MWLAQQIADSLGAELEIVDMSFAGIIPAVQSGQVDLGIAAFTNTPERAEEIDFSDLYETSAQLLIVKTGNADTYSTKEALAGQDGDEAPVNGSLPCRHHSRCVRTQKPRTGEYER